MVFAGARVTCSSTSPSGIGVRSTQLTARLERIGRVFDHANVPYEVRVEAGDLARALTKPGARAAQKTS